QDERLAVRGAAASVTGTIQPNTLAAALDQDAREAGLAARLLLAMPPAQRRVWTEVDVSEDVLERLQHLLRDLVGKVKPEDVIKRKPVVLSLTAGGKALWVEWFNEWGAVQDAAEGDLASAYAKIEAAAARLALLHHVVGWTAAGESDVRAV